MKDFNNFKIDKYLGDGILSTVKPNYDSNFTKFYVYDILSSSSEYQKIFKDFDGIFNSIKTLDSNYQYDLYSFEDKTISNGLPCAEKRKYILKIASHTSDCPLENEYNNLKTLNRRNPLLAPIPILYDVVNDDIEDISMLVISFEYGDSFNEYSIIELEHNIKTIANNLSLLHEDTMSLATTQEISKFNTKLSEISNYESNLSSDEYAELSNTTMYAVLLPFIDSLKTTISSELNALNSNKICLCHCNLYPSRILYRQELVKFINFQDSLYLDLYYDIALFLFTNGMYDTSLGDTFINQYYTSYPSVESDLNTFKTKLTSYYPVCYKIILLKIISLYTYEFLIYGAERKGIYYRYAKSYESMRGLISADYPDYLSSLDRLFINF